MHLCPYAMVFLCILSETSEITQTLLENLMIDGAWILGKTRGDVMNKIDLKQKFKALCDVYAAGTDALGFRCFAEKKETVLELEFRRIRLQLVYRRKSSFPAPPSVLYCRVYPEKNNAIFLQLPQLLPLVRQRDYRACYFPYIENEARMEACFRQLIAITQELVPKLEALSASGGTEELLPRFLEQLGFRQEDAVAVLRPGSREQEILLGILKKMENNFIVRYTVWKPWEAYLQGDRRKALSLLSKQKELIPYDREWMEFLSSEESRSFEPMPPECFALRDMRSVTRGTEDGGTLFLGMFVLYPVFALIACLLMGGLQVFYSYGTRCWFGPPWPMGLLLACIPAIFGGLALRRLVIPILNRKNAQMQLDFDAITNGTATNRFAMGIFCIVTAACLALSLFVSGQCIQLYEDHGAVDGEPFSYEDVEAVYYIAARHNTSGDRIERPSYRILLKDGTQIDFDGYADVDQVEEKALPIFLDLGIELIEVDSDKDLPDSGGYIG